MSRAESHAGYEALTQFLYRAPIGLIQADIAGEISMMNPMSAQLLMPLAPLGDLVNLFEVLSEVAPDLRDAVSAFTAPTGMVCEERRLVALPAGSSPDATVRTLSLSVVKLDETTLMASISDVTHSVALERQRLAERVRDLTRTDELTALPNRAVVVERIAAALTAAAQDPAYQFAVLLINCDRFNHVNMTHGTEVGDTLLKLMGQRVHANVRLHDTVGLRSRALPTTGRLGGDEFVVIIEQLRQAEDALLIARRLLDALSQPYGIGDLQLHAGASIGVVLRAQATEGPELVLQFAGMAMRDAKRAGGSRYRVFDPAMKELARRRGSIEADLHRALDEQQLFCAYQPILNLDDRRCAGMEALVRWRHPARGIVPPIEFIEVAEHTGLIGRLGDFVLQEACRQLALWQRQLGADAPWKMSVNVSRAQLTDSSLVERVRHAIAINGLQAGCLQLEITESLAAQDDTVRLRLNELKALGVVIALDDFGTGYSSLACLHQMPVDVVKIDRSFVTLAETSPHHGVLIEATVRVAQSLQMTTVAEGIETAGQAALLQGAGCDYGQGYLFAKPMPADEATRWLLQLNARHAGSPAQLAAG